ncbi:hypothetical protein [Nocardia sp. NPDC050406]|uniref:MmyB family transcriptional regulator n=1 Tax=Nocardia sp. NPDC050406 TaxID=3364318 RepID=UPI0037B1E9B9
MSEPGLPFSSSILSAVEQPRPAELALVHGFSHPSALRTAVTCDIVAANPAFTRLFPGLEAGANLLTWMLLDPMARCVLADWETEARLLVGRFREMIGAAQSRRVEEVLRLCRRATDWERLWHGAVPEAASDERIVLVLEPDSGRETAMHAQTFTFEAPHRTWRLDTLVPAG